MHSVYALCLRAHVLELPVYSLIVIVVMVRMMLLLSEVGACRILGLIWFGLVWTNKHVETKGMARIWLVLYILSTPLMSPRVVVKRICVFIALSLPRATAHEGKNWIHNPPALLVPTNTSSPRFHILLFQLYNAIDRRHAVFLLIAIQAVSNNLMSWRCSSSMYLIPSRTNPRVVDGRRDTLCCAFIFFLWDFTCTDLFVSERLSHLHSLWVLVWLREMQMKVSILWSQLYSSWDIRVMLSTWHGHKLALASSVSLGHLFYFNVLLLLSLLLPTNE